MGKPRPCAALSKSSVASQGSSVIGIVLSILLVVAMMPAAGAQAAYADEPPVERPATSGGDVALESANGAATAGAAETQAPVAQTREDGMVVADGLVYTVADGGLSLTGFAFAEGADAKAISIPAAISVDGKETPVVAVDIAGGQVAEAVVALTLPQSVKSIAIASLAPAFPNLLSVEVAAPQGSSLPAAAGAAALRATYSSFGGALLGQATVDVAQDDGTVESTSCRELLWAPPAMVVARVPVGCLSIAPGAFVDAAGLETVVCFGDVQRIATAERDEAANVTSAGAFTDEQLETVTVVFPDATPAVSAEGDERVSVSMALNDGATQTDKRHAWIGLGFPLERLSMGKPVGALTETVAVNDSGTAATTDLRLISYPGMHPQATDVKHPDESGNIDMADAGLAFTMKSDMTLSVAWSGDKTATPTRVEIPAYITIDRVTYPVTEVAAGAFEGAVFLEDVVIPESVTVIGDSAFNGCSNLSEEILPSEPKAVSGAESAGDAASMQSLAHEAGLDGSAVGKTVAESELDQENVSAFSTTSGNWMQLYCSPGFEYAEVRLSENMNRDWGVETPTYYSKTWDGGVTWEPVSHGWIGRFDAYRSDTGESLGSVEVWPAAGWQVASTIVRGRSHSQGLSSGEAGFVTLVRSEAMGANSLLTTGSFGGTGSALTAARSDHNHDSTYAKLADFNALKTTVGTKLDSSAISTYNTNAKLDAKFNTKVNASDFSTITYSGIDSDELSVFPTSYRKGGTPALPVPKKAGSAFKGWTWAGQAEPTTDANVIKGAFAAGGDVALTANWDAPSASYFFATDDPFTVSGADTQTYTIAVKLSSSAGTVRSLAFENDNDVLVPSGADIAFAVGNSLDASGALASPLMTATGFGAATGSAFELASLGEQSYGVYVRVSVPKAAVDAEAVTKSFVDGSYVAKFVKLNYELS